LPNVPLKFSFKTFLKRKLNIYIYIYIRITFENALAKIGASFEIEERLDGKEIVKMMQKDLRC
jgi:hypothetical protein